MDPLRDTHEWTAMAYRASASVEGVKTVGYAETNGLGQTWMVYDTAALQHMYGANYGTRAGNTVYSWDPNTGQALANVSRAFRNPRPIAFSRMSGTAVASIRSISRITRPT